MTMRLQQPRADYSSLSDDRLAARTREGDQGAYEELWRRHSAAALLVARQFSSLESQDLVAEAYTRILIVLRRGGGPTGPFRPYLYTTIRNIARSEGSRNREHATDEIEHYLDADEAMPDRFDPVEAGLDRSLTMAAFQALPARWRSVLWYTEIEGMTPQEVAPLLGLRPNAVAALALRAREGLRQSWIRAHLNDRHASPECRWCIDRLAARARGSLSARDAARVDLHLAECSRCMIAAAEASSISSRLRMVALPALLGTAATGLLAAGSTAPATAAAADPAGAGASAGAGGAGSGAAGSGIVLGIIGAAIAAALGVLALTMLPGSPGPQPPKDPAPTPSAAPSAGTLQPDADDPAEEPDDQGPLPGAQPPGPDAPTPPPTPAPSAAPVVAQPPPGALTNEPTPTFSGTGAPGTRAVLEHGGIRYGSAEVSAAGTWNIVPSLPLPEGTSTLQLRLRNAGGAGPAAERTITIDTIAPAPPVFDELRTDAAGLLLPRVVLGGEPQATVELRAQNGSSNWRIGTLEVDEDGLADFGQISLPAGETITLFARQRDAATNLSTDSPMSAPIALEPFRFAAIPDAPLPTAAGEEVVFTVLPASPPLSGTALVVVRWTRPDPDDPDAQLVSYLPVCWTPSNCSAPGTGPVLSIPQPAGYSGLRSALPGPGDYLIIAQYLDPPVTDPGEYGPAAGLLGFSIP